MGYSSEILFDAAVWSPALEKFGAVTQLSVALYGVDERVVCGPRPETLFLRAFQQAGYDPGVFAECAGMCLAQSGDNRPPVIVAPSSGLSVVGVSLALDGRVVGAAVAGYALVGFCESVAIARLAREAGLPFQELWAIARTQQPIPARRLVLHGELLRVLGDTLLRENAIRQQSEETAKQLTASAAAKEEFLAVLSHELRTPLTPILGWTSILRLHSDAKVVHAGEVIERNAVLQIRLVEDLLELTRATRGKLTLNRRFVCLNELVRTALDAIAEGAHKKELTLQLVDAAEPLCINGDADRLQQIFRNVLLNAVKFTPGSGAVTITLERSESAGIAEAVVQVRDTGEGIAPEFLPQVFDLFKQEEHGTRRSYGGLGIGLALVKQLTEAHGGTVSVVSDGVGLGTQVSIRLPLAPPPADMVQPLRVQGTDVQALEGLRILVVEDAEDALEAMCMTLERLGANVVTAGDGIEALERVAAHRMDLILCDLRMPRMDGYEFLRELHGAEGPAAPPVIAVSGLASSADHLATEAAGFTAHIDKPFDDDHLLAAVGAAIAQRSVKQDG